jgi:hypothetical protein
LAITYFTTRDDAFVYLFQHVKDIFRLRKLSYLQEWFYAGIKIGITGLLFNDSNFSVDLNNELECHAKIYAKELSPWFDYKLLHGRRRR